MIKLLIICIFSISISLSVNGQTLLAGKIMDKNGAAISGASVSIKDSYDGATSSVDGSFKFTTTAKGNQTITIQYIGYKTLGAPIDVTKDNISLKYVLEQDASVLDPVVIVAGSFDASDEKKAVALKPMDIVTTASASGDIYGALSTLPGTQTVGETGKLFVRGGDDYEAKTFIDGLQVESPYLQRQDGIPSKGRFNPMLFSGTLFSTGGYSAEYGQALSAVVLLKTDGMPSENKLNVNLYSLGFGVSETRKSENSAFIAAVDYINLGPYYKVVKQTTDWQRAPQTISTTFDLINKTSNGGISKTLFSYNDDRSSLYYPYYGYDKPNVLLSLVNNDLFVKNSYVANISDRTVIRTGIGFSYDRNYLGLDSLNITDNLVSAQLKLTLETNLSDKIKLTYGGDVQFKSFIEDIRIVQVADALTYTDFENSLFAESEYTLTSKLAMRVGLRSEYSSGIDSYRIMPRLSFAYKLTNNSQVSAAYGSFYQNPQYQYLKFTSKLEPEEATHFILNYQYKLKNRLFRIEGFYKSYNDLVTYKFVNDPNPGDYANNGYGFAKGIDIFYRDSQSIKNGDFWISYSLLDTKKLYQDYLAYATPKFFSKDNLSVVYKQWISSIKSFIGMSYTYASGRPYYDPNKPVSEFLTDRTKDYNNLSINCSYDLSAITKIPVTFYASVSNVLGSNNIYGYNNAYNTTTKSYDLIPILPQAGRFYLIALFMTL